MKKIVISLVLAAAATVSAFGQIGVGAGYTSKNHNDYSIGGLYVGADYTHPLSGAFSVTPGVALAFTSNNQTIKINETYLDVPVMFNYGIKVADVIAIYPYAGPTLSLGLSSKSGSLDNFKNIGYKRFDLLIGGGVALVLTDMVRVSVGYNYGLLDRSGSDTHINGFNFGVAYLF